MSQGAKGRIFQPKGRRVLMIAYYGPQKDGGWGEIRESAHTEDPDKARRLLDRRLREVKNHRDGIQQFQGPSQERLTVGDLLDALERDYRAREIKGMRQALVHLNPLREVFGPEQAVAVTADRVRKYIEARKQKGKANATINRETEILSRAYRLAIDEKRLAAQFGLKIPSLPENNARQGFFEKDELEALLPKLPAPIDDMARFGAICGWRLSEILGLRWEWLDRSAKEIRIPDSKNGEGRAIALDDEDWKLIDKLWAAREYATPSGPGLSGFVFHRNGRPVNQTTFCRQWRAACDEAAKGDEGLPSLAGKLFHDLRRTAARDMVRGGAPESFAMKVTGHKTSSMFRRYNIVSPDDVRETLRRRREYVQAAGEKPKVASFKPRGSE